MAELEKKFFGNLKGSLGDVVFRQRNEKNYVAHKPKSYTPPDDPKYRERTSKFRIVQYLSQRIIRTFSIILPPTGGFSTHISSQKI